MKVKRVVGIYFSPTGGTKKIAESLTNYMVNEGRKSGVLLTDEDASALEAEFIDLTKPRNRTYTYSFGEGDLVIMASPVYAGRLPNKILPDYEKCFDVKPGALAVPICVFGNRNWDEALREWVMLAESKGFFVLGAGAFGCRHAFSNKVGEGRPNDDDFDDIGGLGDGVLEKLKALTDAEPGEPNGAEPMDGSNGAEPMDGSKLPSEILAPIEIDRSPIGPYYTPLKEDGTPAVFLKAKPETDWGKCDKCGLCAMACPVGSIDRTSMKATGLCIKCQACVRRCPERAKYFDDEEFLSHVRMLEQNYAERKGNLIVL